MKDVNHMATYQYKSKIYSNERQQPFVIPWKNKQNPFSFFNKYLITTIFSNLGNMFQGVLSGILVLNDF